MRWERLKMNISSSSPVGSSIPPAPAVPAEEVAQRRELVQAAKTINSSGTLGENQLVLVLDRATHRIIMRLEDRDTHEVILQLPPEYVLRMAQELDSGSTHIIQPDTDT
jgi:uncharacterized FlaG/YvyC family protein